MSVKFLFRHNGSCAAFSDKPEVEIAWRRQPEKEIEPSPEVVMPEFRITSAKYDSRYADMLVAAQLEERWRESEYFRSRRDALGRWDDGRRDPIDGDLADQTIKSLAIAKCRTWLSQQL